MSGKEAGSGRRRRVEGGERNGTARNASLRQKRQDYTSKLTGTARRRIRDER